jgi:hypothetical protein
MLALLDYVPPQWRPLERELFLVERDATVFWVRQHGWVRYRSGVEPELLTDDNHKSA